MSLNVVSRQRQNNNCKWTGWAYAARNGAESCAGVLGSVLAKSGGPFVCV